jgi:hypothetical protein
MCSVFERESEMKKVVFALMIVLAMSSVTFAAVIMDYVELDYVENISPGPGLRSYTVQAAGIGIVTLSKFTIQGNVNQVFLDPDTQSPWLGDGSADPGSTGRDSYIVFGDLRIDPYGDTVETILDGSAYGPGTLNNFTDNGQQYTWAAYMESNAGALPGAPAETADLFNLVLADGEKVDMTLTLLTATNYDPGTGMSDITTYDLAITVPEPGSIVMLIAAGMCLCGHWLRKKLR